MRDFDRPALPDSVVWLQYQVDVLLWVKKTQALLPNLPQGRLKEAVEANIVTLLEASDILDVKQLQVEYDKLCGENIVLEDKNSTLEEKLKASATQGNPDDPAPIRQSRKMLVVTALLIASLSFLLGRCNGADLDLGGTRRTPDASAVQPSYEERNTRDVGFPTAPGKSGVPPVDYRHSPTTH